MAAEEEGGAQGSEVADGVEGAGGTESTEAADERKKPSTGGSKKVTIRKSVADRINLFNVSGELKSQIRLNVVALALSKLEEQAALDVLDALLEASDEVEDPNGFVCKRARQVAKEKAAELAAAAAAEEAEQEDGEWQEEGGEAGEGGEAAPKKKKKKAKAEEEIDPNSEAGVKHRIKTLNEGEALWEPIRYNRLEALVPMVGAKDFQKILDKLEERAEDLGNPTAWVRKEAIRRLGPVISRCDQLNRSIPGKMDLLAAIDLAQVREPLAEIPDSTAFRLLKELEDKVFEIKDPTSWLIEEAKKKVPSGPLAEQIKKLNASGRMKQQIDVARAMDVLSAVDQQKGTWILAMLGTRAEKIRNPIGWLAAEVRVRLQPAPAKAGPAPAKAWQPAAAPAKAGPVAAKAVSGAAPAGARSAVAPTTPPKRPPPRPPGVAAAKRPRTAEAVAPAAAELAAGAGAAAGAAEEEAGEGADAGDAEAAEEMPVEGEDEVCQFDDEDGEDPDAIG